MSASETARTSAAEPWSDWDSPPSSAARLKAAKLWVLQHAERTGLLRRVRDSDWRRRRLLILAYHGISLADEYLWSPELYMQPEALRARFEVIRDQGYSVLPLRDAIERLRAGILPPRALALTFDDGTREFLDAGVPLLREFGFPATVYVTTYYAERKVPVFRMACRYLLWKGRGKTIPGQGLTSNGETLELHNLDQRDAALSVIEARLEDIDGGTDQELATLRLLAERVGADFDRFLAERRLQLMSPDEIRSLPPDLVEVQLHTHRHKVPLRKASFDREIEDNRNALASIRPSEVLDAFCYPSGVTDQSFLQWLADLGIETGVTCEPGLATASTDPLLLPRLVDSNGLSRLEFEGWLSGFGSLIPRAPRRRRYRPAPIYD